MKFWWKDEPIGDLDVSVGLTVKEMRRVKNELGKEYRHPAKFMSAAIDFLDVGPDGTRKPADDWDPDAMAMLVVILHARIGKTVYLEDLDGSIGDLRFELSASEAEAIAGATEGKAPDPEPEPTPPTDATTSTDGSSATPTDSGPSSV